MPACPARAMAVSVTRGIAIRRRATIRSSMPGTPPVPAPAIRDVRPRRGVPGPETPGAVSPTPLICGSPATHPRGIRDSHRRGVVGVQEALRVVAELDRLLAELAEGIVAPDPMTYGSQAAAATQVFEQQRDLALRERNQHQLAAVEAALRRLDDGTFGTCARCGKPVAAARIEALPWAAYCIDCQRIVGRRG